jgi:phage/plasmid-associated DNA primase
MAKTTLKSLLEGYAWDRNERPFGKALPTLEDVQKAYQAKQAKLQEADGMMTINDFNSIFETFYSDLEENAKFMQDTTKKTLKMAIKLLQQCQRQESAAHGLNITRRTVKLDTPSAE